MRGWRQVGGWGGWGVSEGDKSLKSSHFLIIISLYSKSKFQNVHNTVCYILKMVCTKRLKIQQGDVRCQGGRGRCQVYHIHTLWITRPQFVKEKQLSRTSWSSLSSCECIDVSLASSVLLCIFLISRLFTGATHLWVSALVMDQQPQEKGGRGPETRRTELGTAEQKHIPKSGTCRKTLEVRRDYNLSFIIITIIISACSYSLLLTTSRDEK